MANNPINYIYFIIIGMAVVTYFSRELPFIILKGKKLKPAIVEWLSYIPVAVLAALLIPALLTGGSGKTIDISLSNFYLVAGVLTFIFGYFVKNLFLVIIFGIGLLAVLRYLY